MIWHLHREGSVGEGYRFTGLEGIPLEEEMNLTDCFAQALPVRAVDESAGAGEALKKAGEKVEMGDVPGRRQEFAFLRHCQSEGDRHEPNFRQAKGRHYLISLEKVFQVFGTTRTRRGQKPFPHDSRDAQSLGHSAGADEKRQFGRQCLLESDSSFLEQPLQQQKLLRAAMGCECSQVIRGAMEALRPFRDVTAGWLPGGVAMSCCRSLSGG